MPLDRDRYRREVMDPARRAGNVPPVNLYVRYGLSGEEPDSQAFDARVAEVVAYWQELKNRRTHASLAEALIAAHAELERTRQLTPEAFAALQEDARQEQLTRLTRLAEAEAAVATCVGPAAGARVGEVAGGGGTRAPGPE